jgi:hypothetical protein
VKILDKRGGEIIGAATGEFGHLDEIGKPVTLRFLDGEEPQARCAIHLQIGKTYLLRSVSETDPYVISRFDWVHVESDHPKFSQYVEDLKKASAANNRLQRSGEG